MLVLLKQTRIKSLLFFSLSSSGSNVVGKVFLTEFIDDWMMMRVKIENLSVNVQISDLISTAADAAGALILNSEANFHFFLAEQKMHERCAAICNLINRSMHAPTIMTLAEVMLKISRSFPSERNRLCMSLQRNNGVDLAVLHRVIGEERDPYLPFKDASPPAADVVTLVDCVHNRVRGKVVWEDVSNLKLGKRSVIAKSPSNTIFATELGLWFTCAEDEHDDARCVRACVNMTDVLSVAIDRGDSSTCMVTLHSALDSFGDVSIESATSTVHIVLKSPAEAQGFVADLQNKLDLFKNLDEFARRSAVSTISIACASTASLYRSKDSQGTAALPPKKSKEQKISAPAAKTNKLPVVSAKAAPQPAKASVATSVKGADAGKKKVAAVKENIVQDDYSMDIDYGNDDLPMDGYNDDDHTSKHAGEERSRLFELLIRIFSLKSYNFRSDASKKSAIPTSNIPKASKFAAKSPPGHEMPAAHGARSSKQPESKFAQARENSPEKRGASILYSYFCLLITSFRQSAPRASYQL